jgi:hypothetical protein
MTKITIVPDDKLILVDNIPAHNVDMSGIKTFHAIQYNSETGGHLEFFDDTPNIPLNSDNDILVNTGISLEEFIKRHNSALNV